MVCLGQGSTYRPDVRDPAAWQGAADARQEHVRVYRTKALEVGDYGLAEALAHLGTYTDRQMSQAQRKVVARAVVKAAPPEHAALRRAAMTPWLAGEDEGAPVKPPTAMEQPAVPGQPVAMSSPAVVPNPRKSAKDLLRIANALGRRR